MLAAGPLGGLTESKRDRLEGNRGFASADFTAGALLKDLRLLSAASGITTHAAHELERLIARDALIGAEQDIAAVCLTEPSPEGQTR